jgi:hypothetical protein
LQIKQQWDWTKRYHNLCTVLSLQVAVASIKGKLLI